MFIVLLLLIALCTLLLGILISMVVKLYLKQSVVKKTSSGLEFVCQKEYKNWAWGYQHSGMYVDSDGNLYRFQEKKDKEHQYDKPAETKTLEELDLNRGESSFVRKLAAEELVELKQLFEDARNEDMCLGNQTSFGADGGITTFNCYEPDNGKLKVYKLIQSGDQGFDSAGQKGQKLGERLQSLLRE